jgi:uncharacterized protein (TIGR02611 family)
MDASVRIEAMSEHDHLGARPGPDFEDIPDIIRRLRERRARHKRRGRTYRIVYAIAGFTVTLIGLIMFVTPGPALVVIPIGLAMLALEFAWAERALHRAVIHAELAKRKAEQATRKEKVLSGIATALGVAAVLTAILLWDIPLVPV